MVIRKNIAYKVLLTLVGLIAVVFYDTTIPFINNIIVLKIYILGFFLEPLLQWAFDISLREAQILSAWIYLLIASLIFWYLFRKFYQVLLTTFYSARRSWLAITRWQKMGLLLLVMLLFVVIGKTALMFV
jgi:hypothetical protein